MREIKTILRERVSQARREAGFAQAGVETQLGLPPGALSKIESGSRAITSTELAAFAQLCGLNVGWFFDPQPAAAVRLRAASESPATRADLAWLHDFAETVCTLERLVSQYGEEVTTMPKRTRVQFTALKPQPTEVQFPTKDGSVSFIADKPQPTKVSFLAKKP